MGFEKAIEHNKTKRKAYRGSKNFDCSCRNHGGCPICEGNRLHKDRTRESSAKAQEVELSEKYDWENYCGSCDYFDTEQCPHRGRVVSETRWQDIFCRNFMD